MLHAKCMNFQTGWTCVTEKRRMRREWWERSASEEKKWAEEAKARKDKTLALQKGSPTAQEHAERIGGAVYVPLAV